MKKLLPIILFFLILITACSGGQSFTSTPLLIPTHPTNLQPMDEQSASYWPTDGWRTSSLEEQEMDPALLAQMFKTIDERHLIIDSVLVIRNGYIVAEKYYPPYTSDTRHRLYSCTKSFISALIGMAIEDGYIDGVKNPVLDFFPHRTFMNLDELKQSMTLEDLLTMRSGLDWEEGMPEYQAMQATRDWVGFVLNKTMAVEPGSQFNYCSGCSHVMSAIIQETTGVSTLEFAQRRLFEPLNISNFHWGLDGSGIPNGGWGLEMTPRDMAKFGYLFLNEGTWDGQQIVPSNWVRLSTQTGLPTGEVVDYAYQWWVDSASGLYAAQGLNGQKIYVIPGLELVVVFTANMDDTTPIFELVEDWVIPAARLDGFNCQGCSGDSWALPTIRETCND
jgi:CubicO group peptidase (beta-lactamase class C family)